MAVSEVVASVSLSPVELLELLVVSSAVSVVGASVVEDASTPVVVGASVVLASVAVVEVLEVSSPVVDPDMLSSSSSGDEVTPLVSPVGSGGALTAGGSPHPARSVSDQRTRGFRACISKDRRSIRP
jgi:hypothetical protein